MNRPVKALLPLLPAQASAADPAAHAWVAASAGTGKTQVLSARVLRLLLAGTPAPAILCITFTKLAAAEMQERVMARLAWWARCGAADLASDLAALGEPADPDTMARARRLFAEVLEAPQGLAVQTIHAFCQSLIASFPVEAGVAPGFATLDDRAAALLRQRLLVAAVVDDADPQFIADLQHLALAGGETRVQAVMAAAVRHAPALAVLRSEAVAPMLRRGLGLPEAGTAEEALRAGIAALPLDEVRALAQALGRQGGANAIKMAGELAAWLALPDPTRGWAAFVRQFFKAEGGPKQLTTLIPVALDRAEPHWKPFVGSLIDRILTLQIEQGCYAILETAGAHLRVAARLARDWVAAKHRGGLVDYDDMINAACALLAGEGAVDWVRYKLDQRIAHVLVDEAQDTNDAQWQVVRALVEEFFAGISAREDARSLFVVGDFKQSIFGFQGADPQVYAAKKDDFEGLAQDAGSDWRDVPLATNFRSVQLILDLVDAVIAELGPASFDPRGVPAHTAHRPGAGHITLWPPVLPVDGDAEDADDDSDEAPPTEVEMARRTARSIAAWLDPADPLRLPSNGKRVRPQDILVLVRRRSAFSGALVSMLHQLRVPVAGVDRLKLTEPLAVADLMALIAFVLQPGDDLTLAGLLVSPLCGLDHDQLTALAAGRRGTLWQAVQASEDAEVVAARDWLAQALAMADLASPYGFLERVLSGPMQGRARLLARLGEDARDAIDAVLDQALAHEQQGAPTLQGLLAWLGADNVEIKRDPEAPLDAVRLMTVHGAKGLQAPVVVLADACIALRDDTGPLPISFDNGPELPVWLPAGLPGLPERLQRAKDDRKADAARESCRLLYVALTRAEDMLFIGGALGKKSNGDVPESSWYASIRAAMLSLGATATDDALWQGERLDLANGAAAADDAADLAPDRSYAAMPDWARTLPPEEARPPRPLAPSSIGRDDVAAPPPGPAQRAAARRGQALHRLFELLPGQPPAQRETLARGWLAANAPDLDADALIATVARVLDDPAFAAVFAPGALAEAPIAAVVGGSVIAGSVDRLLVIADAVLVCDFKTGRRVPASAEEVPDHYLAQMGAYAAALRVIFPGRRITAALLFTEGPALIPLPDHVLALWHPQAERTLQAGSGAPILQPER